MTGNRLSSRIDKLLDMLFGLKGIILGFGLLFFGLAFPSLTELWLEWSPASVGVRLVSEIFKESGIAVIILIGIAFTLDRRHRETFLQEINMQIDAFKKESFTALYGWTIPKKILSEVEEQIFKNVLIRENCSIEYILRNIPEEHKKNIDETCNLTDQERIIADIVFKYELKNIKTTSIKHRITCFVEKEDAPKFNRVVKIIMFSDNITSTYEEEDIESFLDKSDAINNIYRFDEFEIPSERSVNIEMHYQVIRAYHHTREVYLSILPSMGLDIHVRCNVPNLTILAEPISPHTDALMEIPCSNSHGGYCIEKKWIMKKPLLPYQGIMLWWHKQKT